MDEDDKGAGVELEEEAAAAAAAAAAGPSYELKDFQGKNTRESCWLAINGKVYDVTDFLDDHPGGDDIIIKEAGTDATEAFEEIGHSQSARELLAKYEKGVFKDDGTRPKPSTSKPIPIQASQSSGLLKAVQVLLPIILLVIALAIKFFSSPEESKEEDADSSAPDNLSSSDFGPAS